MAKDSPVSARTLRRTENKLMMQLDALNHQIRSLRGEMGERMRTIDADIEAIQEKIGILAKHSQVPKLPVLSDIDLDAMIKAGLKDSH